MELSLSLCYSFRLKRQQHHLFAALCTVEPTKPNSPFFKTKSFGSHHGWMQDDALSRFEGHLSPYLSFSSSRSYIFTHTHTHHFTHSLTHYFRNILFHPPSSLSFLKTPNSWVHFPPTLHFTCSLCSFFWKQYKDELALSKS